ncbi:MAG: DUF169 domain-containing protein [Bacteroidales bacterium]|jgi:uncharacterized protein (DUF169 family)|nr:DUF169 domain-containing protein [Bacteroidales bacterium]
MLNKLKTNLGGKCTSVFINSDYSGFINVPVKSMRFCEAVHYSFKVPIRLTADNLGCPGARRSTGFEMNDEWLAKEISSNNQIPVSFVKSALSQIPSLDGVKHIDLGTSNKIRNDLQPDLFILYLPAFRITGLMSNLARIGVKPSISPYFFLSVCGGIFATSHINQVVSISFGCPESRASGGIAKNEIVVGLPYSIADDLLHLYE